MPLNYFKRITTKQNIYYLLVLLVLISFGFFGSLSHFFSLALITLMSVEYIRSNKEVKNNYRVLILFFALVFFFFLFFLTSLFRSDFGLLIQSMSPMLPIPIIGVLIIFHDRTDFKLSSRKVSQFSQISVLFSLIVYLLLKVSTNPDSFFYQFHAGRLTLFSGNPIPFSFCFLGLSIFCLADWRNLRKKNRLISFLFFLTGAYFAVFLSGTRGSLLSLFIISPIVVFYISNKLKTGFFIILTSVLFGVLLFQLSPVINLESAYFNRLRNGLETIAFLENRDNSTWLRLDMWSAGITAFLEAPILGYGITERFIALKSHLNNETVSFSHPHNDVIAGFISSGVLGGVAVLISLISGFAAAILGPKRSPAKLYLALMISCSVMVTGGVSTVLFNDTCSAWLAFSTYLIWTTDFKDKPQNVENKKYICKRTKK